MKFLTIFISFMVTISAQLTPYKKINSCSCAYDDEHVIDLSPLTGNPRWSDEPGPQAVNMYSYNPCRPFNQGTCQAVALCQFTGADYYALGGQDSAEFIIQPQTGVLSIRYASNDSLGVTRTSQIVTQCEENGPDEFLALGETTPGSGYYLFTLSSKHCCPMPKAPGSSSFLDKLSIGTKISLGFAVIVVVYLCLGGLVQKLGRKQSGLNILPNHDFWTAVPGLVKDGILLSFSCGKTRWLFYKILDDPQAA